MRGKITKKHTVKKLPAEKPSVSTTQSTLLDAPGAAPLAGEHARLAQLLALLPFAFEAGIDEPFLRNRSAGAKPNPRTGAPWLPKPIGGRWPVLATLIGLIEWYWHQSQSSGAYPETFASQKDFAATTGIPITFLDYLRKKGQPIILPGSRVDFRAVLKAIGQLGMDQIDHIDGDYENNRLTQERADEQAMLNAEKRGELLFSTDQVHAISELHATEVLFEQFLGPFKKDLLELAKRGGYHDQITDLLAKHMKHLPPELIEKTEPTK